MADNTSTSSNASPTKGKIRKPSTHRTETQASPAKPHKTPLTLSGQHASAVSSAIISPRNLPPISPLQDESKRIRLETESNKESSKISSRKPSHSATSPTKKKTSILSPSGHTTPAGASTSAAHTPVGNASPNKLKNKDTEKGRREIKGKQLSTPVENYFLAGTEYSKIVEEKLTRRLKKALASSVLDLSDPIDRNMHHFGFSSIPKQLFKATYATALTELWLTNNHLTKLPDAICDFANLRTFGLGGNNLGNLPNSIGKMVSLKRLSLEHNYLQTLPESLKDLRQLCDLRLDHNQFISIPPCVFKLYHLSRLGLSYNQIRQIPKQIMRLRSLVELDLDSNLIGPGIPEELITLKPSLQQLGLANNVLDITLPIFGQLSFLHCCRLCGNSPSRDDTNFTLKETGNGFVRAVPSHVKERKDGYLETIQYSKANDSGADDCMLTDREWTIVSNNLSTNPAKAEREKFGNESSAVMARAMLRARAMRQRNS